MFDQPTGPKVYILLLYAPSGCVRQLEVTTMGPVFECVHMRVSIHAFCSYVRIESC